jgi:signal peptide peptidase SppA
MFNSKESLLTSMIRRFTGTFAAVFGFLFALFLLLFILGASKMGTAGKGELMQLEVQAVDGYVPAPFDAKKAVILQINVEGVIGKENLTAEHIRKILSQTSHYKFSNGQIRGILLKINSPGGSANVCSDIYTDLMEYKQAHQIPIHTWIDDMCASGGVYLSSTSDYISAKALSIIGSVGVRSKPNFNFFDWMQEHGISQTTVTAGKDKIHFPMFSKMPPGTSSYNDIIAIIDSIYENFLDVVVKARGKHGLTKEKLINIGATVYSPVKAKELGFIDGVNVSYKDAVKHLAQSLSLEEYQVVSFENIENFIDGWKKSFDAKCSLFFDQSLSKTPFSLEADFSNLSL